MAQQVRDPVCGMMVYPKKAEHSSEYKGKTYYFCSSSCKARFDQNPEAHVDQSTA